MNAIRLISTVLALLLVFPPQFVFGGGEDTEVKVRENPQGELRSMFGNYPGQSIDAAKRATFEDWKNSEPTRKTIFTKVSDFCAGAWDKTRGVSKEAWDATARWSSEHSDEIKALTAAAVAIGTTIAVNALTDQSSDGGPYSDLSDSPSVASGKPFTQSQKRTLFQENMARNDGVLRSDKSGKKVFVPEQHKSEVTPPLNEAHVDHINPKSKGGPNSYGNAQILSRDENLSKGDK